MGFQASHLMAQLVSLRRNIPGANAIAVHSTTPWDGELEMTVGDAKFLVMNCPSELSMRQALLQSKTLKRPIVCVTPLQEQDLGSDLRARLAKRKVFKVDAWANVKDIFSAKHLDPSLLGKTWLAEAILQNYPSTDYEAVPTGTLTAQTVWRHVLNDLLGLKGEGPDLRDLLLWTLAPGSVDQYALLDKNRRADILERICMTAGPAARYVLACVETGESRMALPFCLVCEVLHGEDGKISPELQAAAARLEKYTGGIPINQEEGQKLANSAILVCEGMENNGKRNAVDRIVRCVDDILKDIQASAFAHRSCFSSTGFEQLLDGFAAKVSLVLQGKIEPEACWPHIIRMQGHYQGRSAPDRLERAEMAYRGLRWLRSEGTERELPASLQDAIQAYMDSESYVDWALGVLAGSEGNEKLASAYDDLCQRAEELRSGFDAAFAHLLCQWEKPSEGLKTVFGVEHVLDRVVVPLAKKNPVLMVVLDGMSCAVFDELMADILQRGHWYELSGAAPSRMAALATIPSITEVSRLSLLSGRLAGPGEEKEDEGFSSHAGLVATSAAPPVLYRKGDLLEAGSKQLSTKVRKSILSAKQRVVGVVINAVDDYLLKGDQLQVGWRLSSIAILESILQAAQGAGRTVVLTSDHGHVMERGTTCMANESGGSRYRQDDGKPNTGEVRVKNKRVLACGGKLIAPWSANLRYGQKLNGYHGGVSPREMVVPIAVLSPDQEGPKNWGSIAGTIPLWWHLEGQPAASAERPAHEVCTPDETLTSLPLFDTVRSAGDTGWIAGLFKSPVFLHNRALCGRAALSNAKLSTFILILEKHGFTAMQGRLAEDMGVPSFRIPGIVRIAQRMLNIDGYTVVAYDQASGTVSLDQVLLKKQFELD